MSSPNAQVSEFSETLWSFENILSIASVCEWKRKEQWINTQTQGKKEAK